MAPVTKAVASQTQTFADATATVRNPMDSCSIIVVVIRCLIAGWEVARPFSERATPSSSILQGRWRAGQSMRYQHMSGGAIHNLECGANSSGDIRRQRREAWRWR